MSKLMRVAFLRALVFALATARVAHCDLENDTPSTAARAIAGGQQPPFPTRTDQAFHRWFKANNGEWTGAGVWSFVEAGATETRAGRDGGGDENDANDANHANHGNRPNPTNTRGVFAKASALANGATLATVDLEACLCVPSAQAGFVLNKVATEVDTEWALALLLVREAVLKGTSSRFAPFLETFSFFDTGFEKQTGFGNTSAHDDALAGTFALVYIEQQNKKDLETWRVLQSTVLRKFPTLFPKETFTKFHVKNALATVRKRGVRFPLFVTNDDDEKGVGRSFVAVAALVPVAHALAHDPAGVMPCVTVRYGETLPDQTVSKNTKLAINVASGEAGTELRCHRGAAVAVEGGEYFGKNKNAVGDDSGSHDSRSEKTQQHIAVTTSHVTDAESMWRFGGVGVGTNVGNAVTLSLPELIWDFRSGEKSENNADAASEARFFLRKRCGPPSKLVMTHSGPSDALRCAVRVTVASDTEVIWLKAKLVGTLKGNGKNGNGNEGNKNEIDHESSAGAMLRKKVSDTSEALALASLVETTAAILDGYLTSDVEDEALLRGGIGDDDDDDEDEEDGDEDEKKTSITLSVLEAVRCRLREKRLLIDALTSIQRVVQTSSGSNRFDLVPGGETAGKTAEQDPRAFAPEGGFKTAKKHFKGEF
tara:strand:+ start:307 stop:2268 length:1962 start_codon:yes stop_codon:yes gene_type:complete